MKKGLYRTEAIVLGTIDYGESDRILTFYTLDYGKLKGIARGARKSRRRFVGNLEPSCRINLIFRQGDRGELVVVEDAALLDGYNALRSDILRLSRACSMLELVSEMTREGLVLRGVFAELAFFLKAVEAALDIGGCERLLRFFEIRILSALGYMPRLGSCTGCGSAVTGEAGSGKAYFSADRGGVLCARCAGPASGLIPISPATAALLQAAARFDLERLERLKPGPDFLRESSDLLDSFIRFQLGKELKTRRFMEKLRSAMF